MRWFRLYSDLLHKRKIQRLPAELFKHWINILCVANENEPRGYLPALEDVAFSLRLREDEAKAVIEQLLEAGLLDETDGGLMAHDWLQYQPPSDNAAERMARKRNEAVQNTFGTRSEHVQNMFALDKNRTDKEENRVDTTSLTIPPEAKELLRSNIPQMDLPAVRGSMVSWANRMGWEMVTEALRRGIEQKGKQTTWRYVEGILKGWTRDHITSIDELKARDEIRRGQQQAVAANPYPYANDALAAFREVDGDA